MTRCAERMVAMAQPKVLIVEDEPDMVDIMRVNLEQAGYDVTATSDGLEGYEALESGGADAIVLDLNLPNMSGFRFARRARRDDRWKDVPIVVVTAFAFEEVEDLTSVGIDAFITKPFDPADLISKLEFVLSKRREGTGREWQPEA
jgi:two-component system, OmpR family, phosphate regulon response regulator PhoB